MRLDCESENVEEHLKNVNCWPQSSVMRFIHVTETSGCVTESVLLKVYEGKEESFLTKLLLHSRCEKWML